MIEFDKFRIFGKVREKFRVLLMFDKAFQKMRDELNINFLLLWTAIY